MTLRPTSAVLAAAFALTATGCQPPDDQQTGSISREDVLESREDLEPAVVAALDSGNAAYREGDYDDALRYYREANEAGDVAAAWFGIYMAQLALGNPAAADSAMDRAQALAPNASLIRPEAPPSP
ncbi:MAG: hypothetical protein ACLFRX_00845 [Gemmatimonadota bacterium]